MMLLAYALAASLLAGAGAVAAEHALRASGRPGRWPWIAAAVLSLALPLAARAGYGVLPVGVPVVEASASVPSWWVFPWAAMSAMLAALHVFDAVRLRSGARRWIAARVAGVPVRIAGTTGPATIGVLRPIVVLPRWTLELHPRERRLIVLHELEHASSGDVRLMAAAAALLVLVPWHPVLWWQVARLHRAIELDCDARVVRRCRRVRAYARLLLRAGERAARPPLLAAALGRRRPLLERRIEALLAARPRRGRVAAACAAAVLTMAACLAPSPVAPDSHGTARYRYTERAEGPPMGVIRLRELPPD